MGLYLRCHRPHFGAAVQADRGNRPMATVPGFAKDSVGRWRIVEMEVTATSSIVSKSGVSPCKSDSESPFGALKGFLDMRYRSACAEFLILLRARSAGSLSARPLQNRRISGRLSPGRAA